MSEAIDYITYIVTIVTCVLSWLGCFLIYLSWFLVRETRCSNRRFLLYLTLADFLVAFGNLIGASSGMKDLRGHPGLNGTNQTGCPQDYVCVTQSFISTFATLASFFWNIFIAVSVRDMVFKSELSKTWQNSKGWLAHVVCWGLPLLITTPILLTNNLGRDQAGIDGQETKIASAGWCWIKTCDSDIETKRWVWDVFLMTISGKGWEILSYVFIPVVYFQMKRRIKKAVRQSPSLYVDKNTLAAIKTVDRVMTTIPLFFLTLRIWGTIRFLANTVVWVNQMEHLPRTFHVIVNQIFPVLQAVGDSGQGFVNFIIYCFLTAPVRQKLLQRLGLTRYSLRHSVVIDYDTSTNDVTVQGVHGHSGVLSLQVTSSSDNTCTLEESTPLLKDFIID